MIKNLNTIIKDSIAIIKDDYTELWLIVSIISDENPQLDLDEIINVTQIVFNELLKIHNVLLLDEKTETPLVIESDEVLKIIKNRMKSLNRLPNIGDGLWFTKK